jgi:hypothetical protein
MHFSPSDLSWWVWLLCSLGCGIVFAISVADDDPGIVRVLITILFGLLTALTGIVGLVRFVKWIWYS